MPACRHLYLASALLALGLMSDVFSQTTNSLAPPDKAAAKAPSASTPIYRLDTESGAVRFGDGQRGRRPPSGQTQASNPSSTAGGAGAETIDKAEQRIPQTLRHRERAVSKSDLRPIATPTPGVSVERVIVTPSTGEEPAPSPPPQREVTGGFTRPVADAATTKDSKPSAK